MTSILPSRLRRTAAGLVAVLALLAAACGDDSVTTETDPGAGETTDQMSEGENMSEDEMSDEDMTDDSMMEEGEHSDDNMSEDQMTDDSMSGDQMTDDSMTDEG
jgi:pentapeptide MXKDX repeat protein